MGMSMNKQDITIRGAKVEVMLTLYEIAVRQYKKYADEKQFDKQLLTAIELDTVSRILELLDIEYEHFNHYAYDESLRGLPS